MIEDEVVREVRAAREAFAACMGINGLDPTVYPSARGIENAMVLASIFRSSAKSFWISSMRRPSRHTRSVRSVADALTPGSTRMTGRRLREGTTNGARATR